MAQTKKKRQRKHRGTQGGRVDANRKPSRPRSRAEAKARARSTAKRPPRGDQPPTWRSSIVRGLVAAVIFTVLLLLIFKRSPGSAARGRRLHAGLLYPRRLLHRPDDVAAAGALEDAVAGRPVTDSS